MAHILTANFKSIVVNLIGTSSRLVPVRLKVKGVRRLLAYAGIIRHNSLQHSPSTAVLYLKKGNYIVCWNLYPVHYIKIKFSFS